MFQFLIKEQTKNMGESSSRSSRIPKKDRGKIKEKKPRTPPTSTSGKEHDKEDNCSKHSHPQFENSEQEGNPHAALIESFWNQLNALVHKNDL